MLPAPENYSIYPSVVRADQCSEMVIVPNEKAFLLFEGQEYQLTVISADADETSYYTPTTAYRMNATATGGVLRFSHTFAGEQEHLILLEKDGQKLQELSVYSLHEDLYRLRPLKGDLHTHSYRSDGKRDPAALAGHFREQGYEFFALTDHNRFYPGGEIDETFKEVQLGITRVPGEEIHAPGSVVHIVHVGGKSSVASTYVDNREQFEAEILSVLEQVPQHVPEQYRERYAKAMWATQRIHQAGGLAIFPHPFWKPDRSRVYNVRSDFARLLLTSGMFDAYELLGGMEQAENNRSVALWADLRTNGLKLPVVASSDVHALTDRCHFGHLFTLCFAQSNASDAIVDAVRSGRCVAVEATGEDLDRQHRCYGALRLVSYAHFLLAKYYPKLQRICQGEGVAMRAYAMGCADKTLIEAQLQQSEQMRRWFFGLEAPGLPSEEILNFENKWRDVQLQGPLTRGSGLNAPPVTRQI